MRLSPIKNSYINMSQKIYGPDFINLANIKDDKIAFDHRTRFLSKEVKDTLNSHPLSKYEDVVYIVEHQGVLRLLCNINLDDYREGKLITHELVLPDTIQGMLSNLQTYNTETAPTFLISAERLSLESYLKDDAHQTISIKDYHIHIFVEEMAHQILSSLSHIKTLIVGDGHHRLYTGSLMQRKESIFTCIMNIDDISINSIDRVIPHVSEELFKSAYTFMKNQFEIKSSDTNLSKGEVRITYQDKSFDVHLIELESDAFWNNDVYRLNTQVLSQAFGIYDTSQLEYFVNVNDCMHCIEKDENAVRIQLAPVSKEEVMFVSKKKAIMPPKSTAFGPKFPSFLIFNKYE